MVGQKRRRTLPAGVLPVGRSTGPEEPGSRVHAKAPAARAETSTRYDAPSRPPAEQARALSDDLLRASPDSVAPIVRQLLPLGSFALEEIAKRFPGPLWRPSLATDSRLPRPAEISAAATALATFERDAIPYLVRLMRHSSPKVRYYAAVVCGTHTDAELIEPLAQVALDEDRECRRVALYLLSAYQHEPRFRAALVGLRRCAGELAQPVALRRRAISALTQLRDQDSAALFVDLLTDPDRGIATASRVGLRVLTAHDFGFSRDPWLRWLAERGRQIRIEWLIEGLGDSRANIRLLASRELWGLTRFLPVLSETATREDFLAAQRNYQRWWTKYHPSD